MAYFPAKYAFESATSSGALFIGSTREARRAGILRSSGKSRSSPWQKPLPHGHGNVLDLVVLS